MLLTGQELKEHIERGCEALQDKLTVYSAFITEPALRWLIGHVPTGIDVRVVARWQARDLGYRSSDLSCYQLCRDRGWAFGIDLKLHSKVSVFDDERVLIGSSNLTARGLSLGHAGNVELGTMLEPSIDDLDKLRDLEENVTWLDDELFEAIAKECEQLTEERGDDPQWSEELSKDLQGHIERLWISELLHTSPEQLAWPDLSDFDTEHDLNLLGLSCDTVSKTELRNRFQQTREFAWLLEQLQTAPSGTRTNFGWVSNQLHNSLLDEPPPYRRDVKRYVADLFDWIAFAGSSQVSIQQHNHTKSLKLLSEPSSPY
jgi:phosphatidylserine/phosphatidylglycerophosphate/cardiolipin synthase-like enzyme